MVIKQNTALAALRAAGEVIEASLCEVQGAWLALVRTQAGKKLVLAYKGDCALATLCKPVEQTLAAEGLQLSVLPLNANNAAAVRRFVKWTAPTACGSKGTSIGFSDWLGAAGAAVVPLFAKRQLKPVLVDYTPEDTAAIGRNFLEAVDTATWGVLEQGYKEGYGANAAGLKSEDDIVKALLYGYSMIGLDCSEKIDLKIEKLSDEAVDKRFEQFNETFRAAVHASYLKAEFKVGEDTISFTENQLHRIVLEYGEAIMHVQYLYNTYLKNTPWEIDFELSLSKPGKVLTPAEHYLIANELQRNGVKLASLCFDCVGDQQALAENLQLHCEIASTFGYRLSFANADMALAAPAVALKRLQGKAHFKLNNLLWMSAVKLAAAKLPELYARLCADCGAEPVPAESLCHSSSCQLLAPAYRKLLAPGEGSVAEQLKSLLVEQQAEYEAEVLANTSDFLKRLQK